MTTTNLTRFGPRSATIGAIGAALVWTSLSFGALITPAPAFAANNGGAFYTAELAQPPSKTASKTTAIAGGVAWKCQGTSCSAPKGTSRALRVCRELNRELGQVTSFTAKGEALAAEELARCNG